MCLAGVSLIFSFLIGCGGNGSGQGYIHPTAARDAAITVNNPSGTPEGDIDNDGADEDDLVENATFSGAVTIAWSGDTATITNPFEGNGVEIAQDDADVTVTSTIEEVAYHLSGSTSTGSFKVYSDNKFKLTLDAVSIESDTGPAINVQSKKTVFVIMEGASSLTDVETYSDIPEDEDAKAAFFSEGQLVFSGAGSLTVAGKYKHGIVSDDYIRVREGTLTVTEAVKDGIHTNDYFIADGGTFNIACDSDGIDCGEGYVIVNDGVFNLNVADDGLVASYDVEDEDEPDYTITPDVTINGGTFDIATTEGEGIESKGVMTINDGDFTINAFDDGINAIGRLYINGGMLYVYSADNDAIDTNDDISITGGFIVAIGYHAPESGFDADRNHFKITGGTLLGLGGTTSLPTSDPGYQNSIIFDGVSAGTLLHIQSDSYAETLTFRVPQKVFTILYSSAKLESAVTYNLYTGGSVSDGEDFNGMFTSGTYSGDGKAKLTSFTIAGTVTQFGGQIAPEGR